MIGTFIGSVAGFFVAGIPGLMIGGIVGYVFDRSRGRAGLGINRSSKNDALFEIIFTIIGHLAKADGRIDQEEIDFTEVLMDQLKLDLPSRKRAISHFQAGAQSDFLLEDFLTARLVAVPNKELRNFLLRMLVSLAFIDGQLHPLERDILEEVALIMGFTAQEFSQILDMEGGQQHFSGNRASSEDRQQTEEAYRALGVSADDSREEVKIAYRRLMSTYHPDKVQASGVSKDIVALATRKSQEIQGAYDYICNIRGW